MLQMHLHSGDSFQHTHIDLSRRIHFCNFMYDLKVISFQTKTHISGILFEIASSQTTSYRLAEKNVNNTALFSLII